MGAFSIFMLLHAPLDVIRYTSIELPDFSFKNIDIPHNIKSITQAALRLPHYRSIAQGASPRTELVEGLRPYNKKTRPYGLVLSEAVRPSRSIAGAGFEPAAYRL